MSIEGPGLVHDLSSSPLTDEPGQKPGQYAGCHLGVKKSIHENSPILDERRPTWHAQLMLREMTEPTQACVALVESCLRPRYDHLDEIIRELVSQETSAADRYLIAFSIIGQCLHFKALKPIGPPLVGEAEYSTYDVARLAEHITQFSLAALRHGKSVWARLSH